MTTGEKIRAAREAAGLSQTELAQRCGWTRGRQHQLETDWRGRVPTVDVLRKVAEPLGVEWHTLFSAD